MGAYQQQPWHTRVGNTCVSSATSDYQQRSSVAIATMTPVSAIAVYQQAGHSRKSDELFSKSYNNCIPGTRYQQRSAKEKHIWHSHAGDGCIPTATSEAAATMTAVSATVALHQQRSAKHDTPVSVIAVYQQRVSSVISKATATITQPCQS